MPTKTTPGPRVAPAEVIDWTIRRELGHSLDRISADTGRHPNTLRRHLIAAGTHDAGHGRHITDAQRAAIIERYQAGETVKSIGEAGGHTAATVLRVIHAAGIPVRPRGRRGAREAAAIRAAREATDRG